MTNEPASEPTEEATPVDQTARPGPLSGFDLLRREDLELAESLQRVIDVVANEAARSRRFARALKEALANPANELPGDEGKGGSTATSSQRPRARNRRPPGVIDPFAAFSEGGEPKLREVLQRLDLEQLRDIVAEHGMDNDRLAMKWKDEQRVIGRIVDRVVARSAKGSAFRGTR